MTKIVAVRGNEADTGIATGHAVIARRPSRPLRAGCERPALGDAISLFGAGAKGQRSVVVSNGPQGHFLDKGNIELLAASEVDEIEHFVVVLPLEDDAVQLDAGKSSATGG